MSLLAETAFLYKVIQEGPNVKCKFGPRIFRREILIADSVSRKFTLRILKLILRATIVLSHECVHC